MPDRPWTAGDVEKMLSNPVYAGIGPFPALVDDAFWISVQLQALRLNGPRRTLMSIRRAVLDTFPRGVAVVQSKRWAQENEPRIAEVGPEQFFAHLLAELRAELRDVPAEYTAPVFGFQLHPPPE